MFLVSVAFHAGYEIWIFHNSNNLIILLTSDESNTDDHGSFQETFMKQFQNFITPLLVIGLVLSSFSFGPREQQQVNPLVTSVE